MDVYAFVKPLLFSLDPEKTHKLCLKALSYWEHLGLLKSKTIKDPVNVMGLSFDNKLGLSAGFDKNGDYISALKKLGFGFIEVGTVTPRPQFGNPQPRLFRLEKQRALINRLGFNNKGVDYLIEQLKKHRCSGVIGINIGKNKATPFKHSVEDYKLCLEKVYAYADYVTINISSPNTPNLRDLGAPEYFKALIGTLKNTQEQLAQQQDRYVPLVVKISPDMEVSAVKALAEQLIYLKVDGVIATNTTTNRSVLEGSAKGHNEAGGLSGGPLFALSNQVIRWLYEVVGDSIPIIGVGGVLSPEDAADKLSAGASLVQVYTGFVYGGPCWVSEVAKKLRSC